MIGERDILTLPVLKNNGANEMLLVHAVLLQGPLPIWCSFFTLRIDDSCQQGIIGLVGPKGSRGDIGEPGEPLRLPRCREDQYVTSDGNYLVCRDFQGTLSSNCMFYTSTYMYLLDTKLLARRVKLTVARFPEF